MWSQDTRIVSIWRKWFNFLTVVLILSGFLACSEAKRMEEADCRPRPVTVTVTEGHEVLPYHVLLHRCSGTCHNTSPRVKACDVKNFVEIDLEVTDVKNQKKIVKVTNHTSCYCRCNCKPNEIPVNHDSCNCQCIENCLPDGGGPPVASGQRKDDEQKFPIPYLVGIIAVGVFALFVLGFDIIMCFKKDAGFAHFLKTHVNCGPEKKDPKPEQDIHVQEDNIPLKAPVYCASCKARLTTQYECSV